MAAKRKIEKKVEPVIVQAPEEEHPANEHDLDHDFDFHSLEHELDSDRY